eukprot:TRINITY_DN7237_c0_g1_i3.p1 TRINITY_DN7237_c0_g1~~TRINITY_DN7237_c0_g1_i3.p1  ORF type:complete len:213 (+),score=38.42 TRINITY_DN7237_c0_g1_i3:164-802(+)
MDKGALKALVEQGGAKDVGTAAYELRTRAPEPAKKLLAVNSAIDTVGPLTFPIREPKCYVEYEVDLVALDEVMVTFRSVGALFQVASVRIPLGRAVAHARWISGTINGMWPAARSLVQAGVEDAALSIPRKLLCLQLDPLAGRGRGKATFDPSVKEVYLAFGVSHKGYVVDLRPVEETPATHGGGPPREKLTVVLHRFGEWSDAEASPESSP